MTSCKIKTKLFALTIQGSSDGVEAEHDDNDEDEAALKMELEELLDGEEIDAANAENVNDEDEDANVDTSAFTLKQHSDPVLNVKITKDGGKLACAGQDDKMTLWNLFDLQSLKQISSQEVLQH